MLAFFSLSSPRKTEPKLIILGLFSAHRRKDGKGGRKTFIFSCSENGERERERESVFLATWNGVKEDERRTRSGSHEMGPFSVVHSIQGHAGEKTGSRTL